MAGIAGEWIALIRHRSTYRAVVDCDKSLSDSWDCEVFATTTQYTKSPVSREAHFYFGEELCSAISPVYKLNEIDRDLLSGNLQLTNYRIIFSPSEVRVIYCDYVHLIG